MFSLNLKLKAYFILIPLMTMFITSCTDKLPNENVNSLKPSRWYTTELVEQGEAVYRNNCVSCHLDKAQGTLDWEKRLADGSYPPPPLNGTAHTWHHNKDTLLNVINHGGAPNGGNMPAFNSLLTTIEKQAVIAYFQSYWTDEIYQRWEKIESR